MQIINPLIEDKITTLFGSTETMYPYTAYRVTTKGNCHIRYSHATLYGYTFETSRIGAITIQKNNYFCIPRGFSEDRTEVVTGDFFVVVKYGFHGQSVFGEVQNGHGRLSYINGCSDNLLVYPPRMGDPSLNYLHFPSGTTQDFHNHPSDRVGVVINGFGTAETRSDRVRLETGNMFLIEAKEIHKFITHTEMEIVVYHPDGDWGPTDEVHTMLNRTHIVNR